MCSFYQVSKALDVQVMGTPSDACKVKFQAVSSDEAGNYTQWDSEATLATSIAVLAYAVIKFSIFPEKSSSKLNALLAWRELMLCPSRQPSSLPHCAPCLPTLWIPTRPLQ